MGLVQQNRQILTDEVIIPCSECIEGVAVVEDLLSNCCGVIQCDEDCECESLKNLCKQEFYFDKEEYEACLEVVEMVPADVLFLLSHDIFTPEDICAMADCEW
eukprot:CAMPEP_0119119242 /NCGR_PEP_ID=MMETSP1310-20130426/815_1 /TAXON_ID=464262 /ORGANISM="Genus nov. species nov., Strain RCC2339" /LENGTH=102 /DNA_ID=CAMNT_0007108661 /DNA_START=163 /DNA_END=468 /DNA_ORIENTATION=-